MRVVILGNAGSGKSTMARRLAAESGSPVLALDDIAWDPGPVRKPINESGSLLGDFVARHELWIVEGCYAALLGPALAACTELRFLNPGVEACVANCLARPWEPDKFATPEAQQQMLDTLINWVREYELRNDEYGLSAHRAVFDAFRGAKREYRSLEEAREVICNRLTLHSYTQPSSREIHMAKSPEDATATMIANLKEKTGKTLEQWVKIATSSKLAKHGEIVAMLKKDHGLTHGYANLVAHSTLKSAASDAALDDLVAAQYSGAKAGLKPIYDALVGAIAKFGKDVEFAPKKAYVSVRRAKQFAILQPSTGSRLDVGINLKGEKPTDRLETSGSFNAMVSHRVRLASAKDVDQQLTGWLKQAYDAAG